MKYDRHFPLHNVGTTAQDITDGSPSLSMCTLHTTLKVIAVKIHATYTYTQFCTTVHLSVYNQLISSVTKKVINTKYKKMVIN
jgi:hypothetical protein